MDGYSTTWWENGNIKSYCYYKKDQPEGIYRTWHINKNMYTESNFENGLLNEYKTTWLENGNIKNCYRYKKGEKNGLCAEYNIDGKLITIDEYENDAYIGPVEIENTVH